MKRIHLDHLNTAEFVYPDTTLRLTKTLAAAPPKSGVIAASHILTVESHIIRSISIPS